MDPTSFIGLPSDDMTDKLYVDLSGAPQTMLATFYAKALDAGLPDPILGDRFAKEIVDRIDYDWKQTAITAANSPSVANSLPYSASRNGYDSGAR